MEMFSILLTGLIISSPCKGFTGIRRAGANVHYVSPHSPAFLAGVHVGDKIITVDGENKQEVTGPAGSIAEVDIKRGNQLLHFSMKRVPHEEAYNK